MNVVALRCLLDSLRQIMPCVNTNVNPHDGEPHKAGNHQKLNYIAWKEKTTRKMIMLLHISCTRETMWRKRKMSCPDFHLRRETQKSQAKCQFITSLRFPIVKLPHHNSPSNACMSRNCVSAKRKKPIAIEMLWQANDLPCKSRSSGTTRYNEAVSSKHWRWEEKKKLSLWWWLVLTLSSQQEAVC